MLERYTDRIRALPPLNDDQPPRCDFELWSDTSSGLSCYYAPFDHVNKNAELVLIGITPGGTQMNRALSAASQALRHGQAVETAVATVKRKGSFSGNMRKPLIEMLDKLGYQRRLGIASCEGLWDGDYDKVHFTSLLRNPVFVRGGDYRGNPNPLKHPKLREVLLETFVPELQQLPQSALLLPLGEKVLKVLTELKQLGLVRQDIPSLNNRFVAPPHPSGSNRESIELILQDDFPDEASYLQKMYQRYRAEEPWLRKHDSRRPQSEDAYKKVRRARWLAMREVRQAHGLPV